MGRIILILPWLSLHKDTFSLNRPFGPEVSHVFHRHVPALTICCISRLEDLEMTPISRGAGTIKQLGHDFTTLVLVSVSIACCTAHTAKGRKFSATSSPKAVSEDMARQSYGARWLQSMCRGGGHSSRRDILARVTFSPKIVHWYIRSQLSSQHGDLVREGFVTDHAMVIVA